jgi:hypothetical protein
MCGDTSSLGSKLFKHFAVDDVKPLSRGKGAGIAFVSLPFSQGRLPPCFACFFPMDFLSMASCALMGGLGHEAPSYASPFKFIIRITIESS